jgi:hypothetical protein
LFDDNGNYLGWVEEGKVWRSDGTFLGEIVEDNYILRRKTMIPPIPKIPKIPPILPIPPIPSIDRIGKIPKIGWVDALDEFREE